MFDNQEYTLINKIGIKTPEFKPVENTEVAQVYEAGSQTKGGQFWSR